MHCIISIHGFTPSPHPLPPLTAPVLQTYTYIATVSSYQILVYGQSVGSGPSCYLATTKPVAGTYTLTHKDRQINRTRTYS